MAEPIINPELPFVGDIPAGLQPGKMLRFQGVTHPNSDRFNINLATGPNAKPRDDTALHVSVRLNQGYIARNTYKDGSWGDEQGSGKLPIGQAQSFEIIILVEPHHYKIAVNGQHFCEFPHRIPYEGVTHLLIDGDVSITLISFEGIALPGDLSATQASQVHSAGPQFGGPQYGPPPGAYGAPPPNYSQYGPPPPGAESQSAFSGFLDQAQDMLAGAIKTAAAEKLLGSILNTGGQSQQQSQGYAPQNAKYGIYPDLPTQDTSQIPNQNPGASPSAPDSTLSNLIAASGGTVTTGPQPTIQTGTPNSAAHQEGLGLLEGLLRGLLSGGGSSAETQQTTSPGQQQQQSSGTDGLSRLLSSLLSGNTQNQQPGGQAVPPQSEPSQGSDVLSGILASLLSSNQNQQNPSQPQTDPQRAPQTAQQGQGSDVLSGILSSLLSPNQNQQPHQPSPQSQGQAQGGGSDILSGILQSLTSGSNQSNQNVGPGQVPNAPPQSHNNPPSNSPNPGQSGLSTEMLANLLPGLSSKAGEQHNSTRPIQETHPSGQQVSAPQDPQQQYGQYPHPSQQDQKGPVESLLSGLLGGGGQQQQQQHPAGQPGGDGLSAMGGILGSLAGSLLHRPDHH